MKKYIFLLSAVIAMLWSCQKKSLELNNPNEPTPDLSLVTEAGLKNLRWDPKSQTNNP